MSQAPSPFWCVGGVLIDHIGRSHAPVRTAQSNPGAARLLPGGVAFNIARAIARLGGDVALTGAVGRDAGAEMIADALRKAGVADHLIRTNHPTGSYLAIEDADGEMFAGVSDLSALETLSAESLRTAIAPAPTNARIIIDANLTEPQIAAMAETSHWLTAEVVSAPKAPRLIPILPRLNALFCNYSEALALGSEGNAQDAATALAQTTQAVVFVTDGPRPAVVAHGARTWTASPPQITAASVTGAGDAFAAGALTALAASAPPEQALHAALSTAAAHLERQS